MYYKDENNKPYQGNKEIFESKLNVILTEISKDEFDTIVEQINAPTQEDINAQKLAEIKELEISLLRPLRELNSTLTSAEDKAYAQNKINDIEAKIQGLRDEIQALSGS